MAAARPYPYLAVVEYNMRPVVPGKGSGIFLHGRPAATIGCLSHAETTFGRAALAPPGDAPVIAIGTRAQLRG